MANISIMDALTRVSRTVKDYIDRNNLTDDQMNIILAQVFGSSNIPVVSTKFSDILSSTSTWQVFGDSISTTYNISENEIWHNLIIADSTYSRMTKYNNSLSGSEVSDGGRDIDSFVERYTSLNSNATLVTIFAGVNDWCHNNIPLGNYDDVTTIRSFYGALNTLLPGIKTQCPNARIIWLSPLKTKSNTAVESTNSNGTNAHGLYLTDYIQAIKYKCHQYNVEFIDLYGVTGLDPDTDTANFQGDGLHLTAAGQAALKDYLLNTALASVPLDIYGETPEIPEEPTHTNTVSVNSLHNNSHFNLFYAIDASTLNNGDNVVVSWTYSNLSGGITGFNNSTSFFSESYEDAIRTDTTTGLTRACNISQGGNHASGTSTSTINATNSNNYPYFLAMTSFGATSGSTPITWHIDSVSVTVNGVEVPILGAGGFFTDESITVDYGFSSSGSTGGSGGGSTGGEAAGNISGYATDGICLWYDGIQNTRAGNHNSALSGWEDLSGNNNDLVIPETKASGFTFGDNHLYCQIGCENEIHSTNGVDANATSLTFEIVVQDLDSTRYPQWYACTRSSTANDDYVQILNSTATQLVTTLSNEDDQFINKPSDAGSIMSLVVTYDRSTNTMKSYLNNTEIVSYTTTAVTDSTRFLANQLLLFSAGFSTSYDAINAKMYAVRIYNRVLSESERTTNYNNDVSRFIG